ncbi:MAG TPA: flavin reductase family protein, partial [Solirubrobacterales bacterium]
MIIDPAGLDRRRRNALINGLVSPRPIAWVSSLAPDGARNLAPFSFFGAFSFDPPTIGIGPGSRQGEPKDTLRNVEASGELVVNLVDRRLAAVANACSGEWGPGVDEWEVVAAAGVTPAASETVRPPRVEQAPAALECSVVEVLELGSAERRSNGLVVARVNRVHVADRALRGLVPDSGEL